MSLNNQMKKILEKGIKQTKKNISKQIVKQLKSTTPVRSGKLKKNFKSIITKNKIIIKDKMKYWFYVEFGPHSKSSLGFGRRVLSKVISSNNLKAIIKKSFK